MHWVRIGNRITASATDRILNRAKLTINWPAMGKLQ